MPCAMDDDGDGATCDPRAVVACGRNRRQNDPSAALAHEGPRARRCHGAGVTLLPPRCGALTRLALAVLVFVCSSVFASRSQRRSHDFVAGTGTRVLIEQNTHRASCVSTASHAVVPCSLVLACVLLYACARRAARTCGLSSARMFVRVVVCTTRGLLTCVCMLPPHTRWLSAPVALLFSHAWRAPRERVHNITEFCCIARRAVSSAIARTRVLTARTTQNKNSRRPGARGAKQRYRISRRRAECSFTRASAPRTATSPSPTTRE